MPSSIGKIAIIGEGIISIKIVGSLPIFKEVDCNVVNSRNLSQILKEYTTLIGVAHNSVKFSFNGVEVKTDHITPRILKMKNGDVIQVERRATPMNIKILDSLGIIEKENYTVICHKPLFDITKEYANLLGGDDFVKFTFNGKEIQYNDTPESLGMKSGDVIRISDCSEVSLRAPKQMSMQKVRFQYERSIGALQDNIWIHNGRVLATYDNTSLSLNIKDDDIIHVYTEDDIFNVKVSLQIDIPNGIDFSLKYGDSLDDIMKEYTDRNGIDINSVRFMYDGKRIKSGSKPDKIGIPPNAVIHVFKEYETITLEVRDYKNCSNKFQIEANYGDSFTNIIKDSGHFGEDPSNIGIHPCYNWSLFLDEQTPQELEMDNINLFVKADDKSTITDIRVSHKHPLDDVFKRCTKIAGVELDSVYFLHRGWRIRKGRTPYILSMTENDTIEMQEKVVKLKLLKHYSPHFRILKTASLGKMKKAYADHLRESVSSLRFLFDGVRFNDEDTPRSLEMEEDDVIEVYEDCYGVWD